MVHNAESFYGNNIQKITTMTHKHLKKINSHLDDTNRLK